MQDEIDVLNENINPKYKVYTALLTQTGTNSPFATVLENTIGVIEWNYNDPGVYAIYLLGAFPVDKTFVVVNLSNNISVTINAYRATDDIIIVKTAGVNNILNNNTFEIRVYN